MKFAFVVATLIAAVVAAPGEYVPFNQKFGKRCVECPEMNGAIECCFELSACYTPGCNE